MEIYKSSSRTSTGILRVGLLLPTAKYPCRSQNHIGTIATNPRVRTAPVLGKKRLHPPSATAPAAEELKPKEIEERWRELEEQAKEALGDAATHVASVEEAETIARTMRIQADVAERIASEAEAETQRLVLAAEVAVQDARAAAAALRGASEELSMAHLHDLASNCLHAWLDKHASCTSFQEASEVEAQISGLANCMLAAHCATAVIDGRAYAVLSLAAGELQPEGALAGLTLHWGCTQHACQPWAPPPAGWHTIPDRSFAAGKAWQTPFGMYVPVIESGAIPSCAAHAVVLQLPLEGVLAGGGITAVLKRPAGNHPEWLVGPHGRDFFFSFDKAWELAQASVAEGGGQAQGTASSAGLSQADRAKRFEEAKQERRRKKEERSKQKTAGAMKEVPSAADNNGSEAEVPKDEKPAMLVEDWVAQSGPTMPVDNNGTLLQKFKAALQLLQTTATEVVLGDSEERAQQVEEAKRAFEEAGQLVVDADQAQEEASQARKEADCLLREAAECEERARRAGDEARSAVRAVRQANARLKGRDDEVTLANLHEVASARLEGWAAWVASRNTFDEDDDSADDAKEDGDGLKPLSFGYRLNGVSGSMAAHIGLATERGRPYALVTLAAAEAFPEGLLEGAVFHWGVTSREGGSWVAPPEGWQADPDRSMDAGGAMQTPFERVPAPQYEQRPDVAVYALTLQIPLEGRLMRGGIVGVIKTASGQWIHSQQHGHQPDFFISTREVGDYAESLQQGKEEVGDFAEVCDISGNCSHVRRDHSEDLSTLKADELITLLGGLGTSGSAGPVSGWMVDEIIAQEPKAERSLMHRFNIALGLLETAMFKNDYDDALMALAVWLRFSAARHLTWNRNFNVKPREISAAQDRLTNRLAGLHEEGKALRDTLRISLIAVGRGGQGDVGQRIRDEILHVQQKNSAKGGMMEEWHQKLHNNTSPDDVIICQALLDYIDAGLDMSAYWATLKAANITKERLASFDRPIVSEPKFTKSQCEGLKRDLTAYLQTLKAVHSGADLESAVATVLGYRQPSVKGKAILVDPVPNVATPELREALQDALLAQKQQAAGMLKDDMEGLQWAVEAMVLARRQLLPALQNGNQGCGGRLRDVLYLDLAMEAAARALVEANMDSLKRWAADSASNLPGLTRILAACLHNACLAFGSNQELVLCLKDLEGAMASEGGASEMRAAAAADRLRRALGSLSVRYTAALQPTAETVGRGLGLSDDAISLFSEEVIRGTAATPCSQLLSLLDPALRRAAGLGAWQIISPASGTATGKLEVAERMAHVQHASYREPTVLLVDSIGGEEDIPEGCVAVVTSDVLDVLCHAAVRARNIAVLLASCSRPAALAELRQHKGHFIQLTASQGGCGITWARAEGPSSQLPIKEQAGRPGGAARKLQMRPWGGVYAVPTSAFGPELVGAKSLNIIKLRGELPMWVKLPSSVAIPFGSFEAVLQDEINADVSVEFVKLAGFGGAAEEDLSNLASLQAAVQRLRAPEQLKLQLRDAFAEEGIPWAEHQWDGTWSAIKKVWASKWNDRAVLSLRRAGLSHALLQMAVLCQQVVPAQYAFVAHTTHPTTGNKNEMYVEVVRGLGEALVGNWPGTALSFTAAKAQLLPAAAKAEGPAELPGSCISVMGFPSKSHALLLAEQAANDPVAIFRSDSNGEDLEGYAGAGLFDSVQSLEPRAVPLDYSTDQLIADAAFRHAVLSRIALAASAVEEAAGSAQDIEGVITAGGELFIVQTRPQV